MHLHRVNSSRQIDKKRKQIIVKVDQRRDSNPYDVNPTGYGNNALTYWTKEPNRIAKYELIYLHGVIIRQVYHVTCQFRV